MGQTDVHQIIRLRLQLQAASVVICKAPQKPKLVEGCRDASIAVCQHILRQI